jgi:hypothetical protein
MGGYIAARWFTVHASSAKEMRERFAEERFVRPRIAPAELATMLPFSCDLVKRAEELEGLEAVLLLEASQATALRRGVRITLGSPASAQM